MNGCIIPIDSGHAIFISTYLTLSKPSNSGLSRIFRYKTKAIFSHIEAPSLMETRAGFHICDTVTSTIFTARWWYLSYGIIIPFLYEFLVENSTFFEATNDTGPSNSMQFHWITYVYICIIIFKHIHPVCFFGSTSFYRHGKKHGTFTTHARWTSSGLLRASKLSISAIGKAQVGISQTSVMAPSPTVLGTW